MNSIADWAKASWTNLLWVIAGIVVALDPGQVEEWARRHEGWADLIIVLFGIILAWAGKYRQSDRGAQGKVA